MKSIKKYIFEAFKINKNTKLEKNDCKILLDSSENNNDDVHIEFMNWMDSLNKKYPLFVLTKMPLENVKSENDFYDFSTDLKKILNFCLKQSVYLANSKCIIKLNNGHIEMYYKKNNVTYFIYVLNYDGDDLYDAWDDRKISTETFVQDLLKYGIEKITT